MSEESAIPPARATTQFFGHHDAEQTLLDAYRGGRIAHAWLMGGPTGIGKATLAYRMARFVLAHPDPTSAAVQTATSLAVPEDHPVASRIAAGGHGNLLVLERSYNDKGKLRQDIAVDDVRTTVRFFGETPAESGWRIAIVDSVEELNRSSANALLKILEEPPKQTLLLLVTHTPGATLATIRSRCRRLLLGPLSELDVRRASGGALRRDPADADIVRAAAAAEGSVGRALLLMEGNEFALREQVSSLLSDLPRYDPKALHALADSLAGTDQQLLSGFVETVNNWLSARLKGGEDQTQCMRAARAWEKINQAAREVEIYNLDRKPFVFSTFATLAEAARR